MTRIVSLAPPPALCLPAAVAQPRLPLRRRRAPSTSAAPSPRSGPATSTVTYVSNSDKYYLAYQRLAEEQAERLKAKDDAAKPGK